MSARQGSMGLVAAVVAMVVLATLLAASLASAQPKREKFNHLATGFALTGAHERAACESCHLRGIFKGTTKECSQCHGPGTRVSSVTQPASHIPTAASCDSCHTTQQFQGARFDHATAVQGECGQCHNANSRATAKPARHIVTTAPCDTCHRRSGWLPATFNHAAVAPGSCAQCHNGTTASGRSATHIPTSASCDSCHTPGAWRPASRFDHAAMLPGSCNQCHDGTRARGQKPQHIPTAAACDACHSKSSWLPARTDHSTVVAGTCVQCHDGRLATGKKPTHIPTTASCDSCHRTTAWVPTSFTHKGVAAGTCAACHNGTQASGKPTRHLPTASSCDSCHSTAGWRPALFNHAGVATGSCRNCHNGSIATGLAPTHIPVATLSCDSCHGNFSTFVGAPMNHGAVPSTACTACHETGTSFFGGRVVTRPTPRQDPVHPQTGECGACHGTTSFATVGGKPANHIPTAQACATCHTALPDFKVATMSHAGITSGCAQCHGPGLAFSGGRPKAPPANHIPSLGTACESCHNAASYASWAATPMNHAAVASSPCATCHEAGKSWFGVRITTRPAAPHPASGDCIQCHSTASFKGAAQKPANHLPTTQTCTLCHTNPPDYKAFAMNHAGITGGCATCHGGAVFATNFRPTAPPASHIPATGVACESCHAATKFTTFSGTAMNHASTGAIACATCHEAGRKWFGVTIVTRPTRTSHPATGDCATCHNTATFNVAQSKPANHIPTAQACTLCHATPGAKAVMSHAGITGNCAQCHGSGLAFAGVVPKQAPATHIPTANAPCENCHSASVFTSFAGTRTNHAAVASMTCMSCHEAGKSWFGVAITTRPLTATHPRTGDCSACHTTSTFRAPAKPASHIPTTQACALCHTALPDFKVATMSHAGITSGCAQCHGPGLAFSGGRPKPPPATHIPSLSTPCESCHNAANVTSWAGTPMNHAVVAATACATCHEAGRSWFGVRITTRPPAPHPAAGDCNACHTTATFKGAAQKPANHIPTTLACTTCHATSDYSVATMNHQGIASNCALCHGPGLSFAGVVPVAPPAKHIPYAGVACEACHSPTVFTSFARTRMNHNAVAAMKCSACHETGMSWFGVQIETRPRNHHVGQECNSSGCHNVNTFSKRFIVPSGPPALPGSAKPVIIDPRTGQRGDRRTPPAGPGK